MKYDRFNIHGKVEELTRLSKSTSNNITKARPFQINRKTYIEKLFTDEKPNIEESNGKLGLTLISEETRAALKQLKPDNFQSDSPKLDESSISIS